MARITEDIHVHEIRTKIIRLGALVEMALEQAIQALQSGDQILCRRLIASDTTIDDLCTEVERLAFQSIEQQQRLEGDDLRFLSSAPSIARELERMGDNAEGIAKLLLRMAPPHHASLSQTRVDASVMVEGKQRRTPDHVLTEASIISGIVELGKEALRALQDVLHAFEHSDAYAARVLWQEDDVVDVRYHMVRHDIMTMLTDIHAIPALQQDPLIMQRMTYWLWIAHNLERIGDHCTNICERIAFFLEGEGTISRAEEV